jgi:hypothetical protein
MKYIKNPKKSPYLNRQNGERYNRCARGLERSVLDLDPVESGTYWRGRNFRQFCGSGIRCFFDPWIRDQEWEKSGSGNRNPFDPGFGIPGSGMEKFGSGINIPDPHHCLLL